MSQLNARTQAQNIFCICHIALQPQTFITNEDVSGPVSQQLKIDVLVTVQDETFALV